MSRIRHDESGQSIVMFVAFLAVLIGFSAVAVDVGSWYRAHRAAQAAADAAALAGAQALPTDPSNAATLALDYANKNGGGLAPSDITISTTKTPNDTISVKIHRATEGFFSQIFGISSVSLQTKAAARTFIPGEAKYLAPIVVRNTHPMLNNCGGPCFGAGYPTTLPLDKSGAPGGFNLIDLDNDSTGTVGASTLASWIDNGYDGYLDLREYYSDPGAKWNNSSIQGALNNRIGTELLFPVYDVLQGTGSNAEYRVIAWVGFHLTDKVAASGSTGSISGYFTRIIWQGLEATGGTPIDLGVRTVILTD